MTSVAAIIHRKPYENQIIELRRHRVILAKRVIIWAFLAALPFGVQRLLQASIPELLASPVGYPALVLALSAYELGMWILLFTMFLDYELDMWIVTNDRIVSIEQNGLFSRTIAELDLWRVQDVTSEIRGVIPTFLNYGDVYIQTAGAMERFVFEQVPGPNEVRKIILEMSDIDRKFHSSDMEALRKHVGAPGV